MTDLEKRIWVEKVVTRKILKYKVKMISIPRAFNNRISCLNPYLAMNSTNTYYGQEFSKVYSILSEKIHNDEDLRRTQIEEEIFNILKWKKPTFIHLLFLEIDTYEKYINYCNLKRKPLLKKIAYNRVKNLINKWRLESSEMHYKLAKNEKRFLKKLATK